MPSAAKMGVQQKEGIEISPLTLFRRATSGGKYSLPGGGGGGEGGWGLGSVTSCLIENGLVPWTFSLTGEKVFFS